MALKPPSANGSQGRNPIPVVNGRPRVAVIGAGIVGLAHAWAAVRRGWHVLLFERDRHAQGASVRNFGMVWPIGQSHGPLHSTALESRLLWLKLVQETGFWSKRCGSLHLAYRPDELAVLSEFDRLAPSLGIECDLLDATTVVARSPAACPDGLLGGLASDTEMCVDPREIISRMPWWLHEVHGVELHFGAPIDRIGTGVVAAADGALWNVDRVVVAAGADFRLLYPDLYLQAGFRRCKLQMMRTVPQPGGWELGPMLAGGLTLRHYQAFRVCQTLAYLERRIENESPELNRYGIHVMASQNGCGEVILGDSHEYDEQITPFDKALIDELIFREIRRIANLPDWTIQQRWHGIYPVAPNGIEFVAEPEANVHLAIASGGCGMTMSFGLAEEKWLAWHGPVEAGEQASRSEVASTQAKIAAPA